MASKKEWLVRVSDDDYKMLMDMFKAESPVLMNSKVIYPDEHRELVKSDKNYQKLYKLYKNAKDNFETYKFNIRHR